MENRRVLLRTLLGVGAVAATPSSTQARVIRKQPLAGRFEGLEATFIEVEYGPGKSSAPHRHAGFVLGYVLEGSFRFQVQGKAEKTLRPGDTFYEPPDAIHLVSGSEGDQGAKILAIIIAENGARLTTPI